MHALRRRTEPRCRPVVWLAVLGLVACAGTPSELPPAPCAPATAWQAGLSGEAVAGTCEESDSRLWREARNLGIELRALLDERASLDAAAPGAALTEARLQREIDQIRGAALIRGWPLPED
ncbi:MAG: hypothetical protein AAF358_13160 [Pseudomonadota bacterium]